MENESSSMSNEDLEKLKDQVKNQIEFEDKTLGIFGSQSNNEQAISRDGVIAPNELHDQILQSLLEYRDAHSEFNFWLRERNTNNRLNEGYWFQGTEHYAHVGFFNLNSGNKSTKSVGLVFWPTYEESNPYGCTFEVLYKSESDKKYLGFYDWIRDIVRRNYPEQYEDHGERRFKVFLGVENPFEEALKFLNRFYNVFLKQISQLGISEILITNRDFENKLKNIVARRTSIFSNQTSINDAIQDTEEEQEEQERSKDVQDTRLIYSKYRHMSVSEMRPVIGVDILAKETADFLANLRGDSPILFGIFGRWGRGKTFFFNQIWKILKSKEDFYRVDFHAWKHQQTPASWGYLYEAIANKYYESSTGFLNKRLRAFRLNVSREGKKELIVFTLTLAVGVVSLIFRDFLTEKGVRLFAWIIGITGISFFMLLLSKVLRVWQKNTSKARELYKKYSEKHSYADLLGIQAEIQNELKTLLTTWLKIKKGKNVSNYPAKRILLFVDDIDRCSEDRIIQVVDALRVMLEDEEIAKRIVVVVAIDERILRRAIRLKYDKLISLGGAPDGTDLNLLTKEYLDKLFLAGIKLGDLSESESVDIFNALVDNRVQQPVSSNSKVDAQVKDQSTGLDNIPTDSLRSLLTGKTPMVDPPQLPETRKKNITEVVTKNIENPGFEITLDEKSMLSESVKKLNKPTPRQIRIYYLRYLLIRDFGKSFRNIERWSETEIAAVLEALVFLSKRDLVSKSVGAHLDKNEISSTDEVNGWKSLEEETKLKLLAILEIVVPY